MSTRSDPSEDDPRAESLDHNDFGPNRSKVMNVIDSNALERNASGKPVVTFPRPALGEAQDTRGAAREAGARSGGFLFFVEPSEAVAPEPRRLAVRSLDEVRREPQDAARPAASLGFSGGKLTPHDFGMPRTDMAGARRLEDSGAGTWPAARADVGPEKSTPFDFGFLRLGAPNAKHFGRDGDGPRVVEPRVAGGTFGGEEFAPVGSNAPRPETRSPSRHVTYVTTQTAPRDAAATQLQSAQNDVESPELARERVMKHARQVILPLVFGLNFVVLGVQATILHFQNQRVEQSEMVVMAAARELADFAERARTRDAAADGSGPDGSARLRPAHQMEAPFADILRDAIGTPERLVQPEAETKAFGSLAPSAPSDLSSRGMTRAIAIPSIIDQSSEFAAELDRSEPSKFAVMPDGPALAPRPLGVGRSCRAPSALSAATEKAQGAAKPTGHRRYHEGAKTVASRARPEAAARDSASEQCDPLP
jgi:hypothetical protein